MSDYTLQAGFPGIPLEGGMQIVLEAIDPSTGATVTGVLASQWAIYGEDASGVTLPDVTPLYTAEEIGEPA